MLTFSFQTRGQERTYDLKKGEAFDIILFNQVPESGEILNKYFASAVSEAQAFGYVPQKGFKVDEVPFQGNYWPKTIIIGKWKNYLKRVNFTTEITDKVPDFHEMRRQIWSTFSLTYWEVKEDRTVKMDLGKYNVMTAYWADKGSAFKKFNDQWLKTAKASGGNVVLELSGGTSPFGYNYNPDYLTITSWENKEAFEAFRRKNLAMSHEGVKHVNQFAIK
ncbi:hypothetical protein BFP71_06695 [Roseivirga misakiensis]|uniref:Uncharacterized protein n=2 Tax=Roseivirga misakiensis TaxID=1563681 RepID=A0A1E5T351_9BACT|nr:hypothetical protein BFP71_06695 [Roseivirga misakiensis]